MPHSVGEEVYISRVRLKTFQENTDESGEGNDMSHVNLPHNKLLRVIALLASIHYLLGLDVWLAAPFLY